MPEVYHLLPPVCEKLGIDIPDLYMVQSENRKDLNAFTGGMTEPCSTGRYYRHSELAGCHRGKQI